MRATRTHGAPAYLACLAAALLLTAAAGAASATGESEPPRITLELVDADIRDALRIVAKQGGMNIVMSNGVEGTLSLELHQVTLSEALQAIVDVGGFEHTIGGNIVTVSTLEELTTRQRQRADYAAGAAAEPMQAIVLKLAYVDAERVLPVIQRLLSEGGSASLLQTSDQVAQSNQTVQSNGQAAAPSSDDSDLQIGTRLSSSTRGQPAKSHTIVVADVPAVLERIRAVVDSIDQKPVQIVIEARFVEVSLDDEHKLGVDWNVVAGFSGAAAPHTFPFGDSSLGSFGPNVADGSPGGIFPPAPSSVTTPTTAGLFTFGTLDFTAFSAVLEMIRRDSRVEVVSNPRVMVGDRHTATILVGERFPIFSTNISDFGTVTEQLDRYEPIGVQLEVTPSVLNGDEIELLVRPSTSSLGPTVQGSTGLTATRINSRQIDTSVTALDGQTIVLGGLITTRETDTVRRVPFLASLPLLGKLFTHKSKKAERVDLVVFLTVTILREAGLTDDERAMFGRTDSDSDSGSPARPVRSQLAFVPSPPRQGPPRQGP